MHEYTYNGHPRDKIIYALAALSITISTFFTEVILPYANTSLNIKIAFTLSSATVFGILYIVSCNWLWKTKLFSRVFSYPDYSGEWECHGTSLNPTTRETYKWTGTITIKQTWTKILVSMRTESSTSHSLSISCGLSHFAGYGHKLAYHYDNVPSPTNPELSRHEGFCILSFQEDQREAEGNYFNNARDRSTFGKMTLRRKK